MGSIYEVDDLGNITGRSLSVSTTATALGFSTGVVTARLEASGTTIIATGTDANIDVNITAKGSGYVVLNRADINAGTIDATIIGGGTPAAGTFTTVSGTSSSFTTTTVTGLHFNDTDTSNYLRLGWAENDTSNRTISLYVNSGSRILDLSGDSYISQDYRTSASPTFAGLTLTAFSGIMKATAGVLSAGTVTLDDILDGVTYARVLASDINSGRVTYLSEAGTAFGMTMVANGADRVLTMDGNVTLDQSVSTISSPTFAGLTLTGLTGILTATAGVVSAGSATMDDIADGATYGRVLLTSLTSNEVTKLTDAAGDNFTVALGGSDRVLTMGASVAVDQNLRTIDSPTFMAAALSGKTGSNDILSETPSTSFGAIVHTDPGGGLDDMTFGASNLYTGPLDIAYEVEIDGTGATDTFKWSRDGGVSWIATGINIPGAGTEYELEDGVWVKFAAITGHASGDNWAFTAYAYTGNYESHKTADLEEGSFRQLQRVDTADATPKIIASFPLAVNQSMLLRAKITCIEDAAPATQWAAYDIEGMFYRVTAGNVSQQGSTSVIFEDETTVGMNGDFNLNIANQSIDVLVTGVAATNLKWKCVAEAVIV